MKRVVLLFAILLPFCTIAEEAPLSDISELRWQNRIILMLANQLDEDAGQTLQHHSPDIIDRDIIWFIFDDHSTQTNYPGLLADDFRSNTLARFLNLERGVLLLGKDGGLKAVLPSLNLHTLFNAIDAMPMRQYELQNRV